MIEAAWHIEMANRYGAHTYEPVSGIVLHRGEGTRVWDTNGKHYLDMLSGYGAINQGHCHPRIIAAAHKQLDLLTHTSRAFHHDRLAPFLLKIHEVTGKDKALPMNSGTEGVETGLKMARRWGYEKKGVPEGDAEIVVAENNFHGRTITVVSFSSEAKYRKDFGPFTPGFRTIPFGDAKALQESITRNTVGFLIEPVQAEGGVNVPKDGYLAACKEICEKNDVLVIADEIQTGLGRTGTMFGFGDVEPDILILGKSLSGGIGPVSAAVANNEIMDLLQPGDHGSTFGGNPFACRVAEEALQVIVDENLAEQAYEKGIYLREKLQSVAPAVQGVRGKGLMVGVVLDTSKASLYEYRQKLAENGVLTNDAHGVIRFTPPLTTSYDELNEGLDRISYALAP